ncbi:MAG: hypothetical protein K2J26_00330 [Ruminococcus sp.]|nr:hypothetical protein [Ruminococcus sp.]
MDIETLRKAASILGILTDNLCEMPEDIQEEICKAYMQYEASDELSAHKQYEEIERLWRKGTLILGMNEIAESTGIEIDSLMKLSENEKLNLMYEFAIGTDKNELARMVNER